MLVKCPRCELNYMNDTEKYCKVCMREIYGEDAKEEIEMCTVCSDSPALPGKDVCLFCLKEMNGITHKDEETHRVDGEIELESVSTMDEIIPEVDEDIPEDEYREIDDNLSLEAMEEEELENDLEEGEDDDL